MRAAWRELIRPEGWRSAGVDEYAFAIEALRFIRGARALRVAVAVLAMMMLPLAMVMQFNPMGPHGVPARVVHVAAAVAGFLLGLQWLVGRFPTARRATRFLVASDVLIAVAVTVLSDPTARICGTIHLAMLGLFAAFFLGWRILLVHCAFSLLLIASLTAYGILADGRTLLDLYVYTTPAITTVVGLPVVIQVVVESGRRGVMRVATEWFFDSVTGAYNRRGMGFASRNAAARHARPGSVAVVAVLDLDDFKKYNDTHGHLAGDQLLASVVGRLREVPKVLVARYGGDEFLLFGVRADEAEALRTADELRAVVRPRRGAETDGLVGGSMGVVLTPASADVGLEDIAAKADEALYEAKRSPSESVVVRDLVRSG